MFYGNYEDVYDELCHILDNRTTIAEYNIAPIIAKIKKYVDEKNGEFDLECLKEVNDFKIGEVSSKVEGSSNLVCAMFVAIYIVAIEAVGYIMYRFSYKGPEDLTGRDNYIYSFKLFVCIIVIGYIIYSQIKDKRLIKSSKKHLIIKQAINKYEKESIQ